ncbi:MAG: helix-turn-helix transcriptional regulator [Bacteroidota bacterium]
MNVGIAIKQVRKQLGLTQQELAVKCNISQTSLSQIENGNKRPSAKTTKKICTALDIPESVIYILGMQDTDVPESKQNMYKLLFPSIRSLALEIVGTEHSALLQ